MLQSVESYCIMIVLLLKKKPILTTEI